MPLAARCPYRNLFRFAMELIFEKIIISVDLDRRKDVLTL